MNEEYRDFLFRLSDCLILTDAYRSRHVQGLTTLRAYCHWLSQFYVGTVRHREEQETFAGLLVQTVDAVASILDRVTPEKLHLASARLLVSICSTVRPQYLLGLKSLQSLMNSAAVGALAALPHEAQLLIFEGLSSALVLPWPELPDSEQVTMHLPCTNSI